MSEAQGSATQTTGRTSLRSTRQGVVTSDRRNQTCTVAVDFSVRHAKYGKFLRRVTKHHVHDPGNDAKLGDRVEIARCRPISKTKSWRLLRVIERAPEA